MSEPEEVRFACIGCGKLNPAGAEVCSGCSHRFAGPDAGPIPEPSAWPVGSLPEMHFQDDDLYKPQRPNPDETLLGCLVKVLGAAVALLLTPIAFVVGFAVTCSATFQTDGTLIWSFAAGLTAAGLVMAFTVWIASTIRG